MVGPSSSAEESKASCIAQIMPQNLKKFINTEPYKICDEML
jgi:hypothetical protein